MKYKYLSFTNSHLTQFVEKCKICNREENLYTGYSEDDFVELYFTIKGFVCQNCITKLEKEDADFALGLGTTLCGITQKLPWKGRSYSSVNDHLNSLKK